MSSVGGSGDTGIRSVAASLILGRQGSLILRQTEQGYELTGLDRRGTVFCGSWPEAERVLLRLKLPFHKIDEIADLLRVGTDVAVHREIGK